MNKLILAILLVFIPVGIMASVWPSDVPIAMEFENNVANTGYSSVTATNIGAFTFTTHDPKYGTYTLGSQPTPGTSKRVTVNSITETVKTLSVWINMPEDGSNTQQMLWAYQGDLPMLYSNEVSGGTANVIYLYNASPFWQIGPYNTSMHTWHNYVTTFDGTNIKLYIDGALRGTQASTIQPSEKYLVIGNKATNNTASTQAQIDSLAVSLNDTGGAEIVIATVTATPTNTATNTFTPTVTNTVTPTITPTITPTTTNTPALYVTFVPDKTGSWVLGDTVKVVFTWLLKGYSPAGTNIGVYSAVGGAGIAYSPTPAATILDAPRPQINWVVGTGTDLTGTFSYFYKITNLVSAQRLGVYSGSLLVNDSLTHPIVTATPTITITKTVINTVTDTVTMTVTNTFTPTVTNTFTNTFTNTSTKTITNTNTSTITNTFTKTITNTVTPTFTKTNTYTVTETPTKTNTPTPSYTYSPTSTYTRTPTPTYTITPTQTPIIKPQIHSNENNGGFFRRLRLWNH